MNTWWVPLEYQFPSSSSHSLKWHMEKSWEMLGHTSSRIYEDLILRQLFQLLSHQTTVCTQRPSCSSSRKGPGWCWVSVLFLASKVTQPDLGRDFLTIWYTVYTAHLIIPIHFPWFFDISHSSIGFFSQSCGNHMGFPWTPNQQNITLHHLLISAKKHQCPLLKIIG